MGSELVLILVVIAGFSFDFTNGFHDTANAMATSIATGALKPKVAVIISACLNFAGAFISISVAATIAKGIVSPKVLVGGDGLELVLAALIGAMTWNLITWYFTIPSSSSHALIGGVIGATIVATASGERQLAQPRADRDRARGPVAVHRRGRRRARDLSRLPIDPPARSAARRRTGYRYGQIFSASLVSLAHGTNDAQKTMGVISLALIAHGDISAVHFSVPLWVKLGCALSIAGGTASGGWRIINTMGNRITNVESPQGFAAESSSAAVILASSYYGYPLSTTQVVSGGVLGSGLGKANPVHWNVIGQMVSAWVLTMPGAGLLGGAAWGIADLFGAHSNAGAVVICLLAALAAFGLWTLSKRNPVSAADLDRTNVSPVEEAERAGVPAAVAVL